MGRPCTVCAHPERAAIDAALRDGASLDDVIAQFNLPSRSALQRHRVGHLGRAVTFNMPTASAPPPGAAPGQPAGESDAAAELERLFTRAAGSTRALQDYASLVTDGLAHVYADAIASGDRAVAVRALRELRSLLQFFAIVKPDQLRQHAGWREPDVPPDPVFALQRMILAQIAGVQTEIDAARAELDTGVPGLGTAIAEAGELGAFQ